MLYLYMCHEMSHLIPFRRTCIIIKFTSQRRVLPTNMVTMTSHANQQYRFNFPLFAFKSDIVTSFFNQNPNLLLSVEYGAEELFTKQRFNLDQTIIIVHELAKNRNAKYHIFSICQAKIIQANQELGLLL